MREMDKRLVDQFRMMEQRMGRMFRNMAVPRMTASVHAGCWEPAADVYETEDAIYVYVDTAGIDPEQLSVTAERKGVTISGIRRIPEQARIRTIHQLEIEHGKFRRSLSFNVPVDVSAVTSVCRNGLLEIRMPKERVAAVVTIRVGS